MERVLMNKGDMCIGAQLYTVREYMKTREDFCLTVRKVAEMGYRYMQVSGAADAPYDVIEKAARENGIEAVITHSPPARVLNDTDKLIEEHLYFKAKAIGIGALPYERNYDGYMRFCSEFSPAAEKIAKAGLKLCYHNHRFEFQKYGEKTGIEHILENTPSDLMLTFDTYWAVAAGCDAAKFITDHKERIFCTHLKDMTVIDDRQEMVEVGDGNINFSAIMKACAGSGVKYHFVEQDIVRINAFDSLERSLKNINERLL